MNIFDILGPVMVGPSSSHTAGAARIGYITRKLLGSRPKKARIGLSGSFAATGRGHGTDRALVAGLLGMKPDDMRIPDSFSVAKQEGLEFEIYNTQIKEAHPNTALLDVEGVDGKTIVVQASSLGGGRIMLNELDEITVNCTGACPTLIIRNEDSPGQVAEVTSVLYGKKVNIKDKDVYMYVQKDTSYEKGIFANSAVLILGCVFLSGNLVFIAIADIIVKPITRLTNATKELSKGNYNVRVNYVGDDEISKLNQGFNQMAQQLAKQEETRQKFISDISHEFQTPLTAIQGFANILKDEDLPKSQRQKYADIILFHSKRLSTLSKNMLQLTLLEREEVELEYTTFSIVEQLSRVISTQENQAILKDIEIVFEKPRKDITINGDEQRLEQVWINIISNAIKYTDNGGLITIKVKKTSKEVEVSIEDTGRGMSKEVISHIFERFYREDKARSVEGNGLGLSIVKSIIDLHHGNIDVISQVDVGSTFIIKLPNERKTFDLKEKLSLNRKD